MAYARTGENVINLPTPPYDWVSEARCAGKTDLFFAPPGERSGRRRRREALALSYCEQCPSREPCRTVGRLWHEHGIWGGETDEERAAAGFVPRSPHRRALLAVASRAESG